MKAVHKLLTVLVYWSVAAVAHGSDGCIHGDIRLTDTEDTPTGTRGILEVCIEGSWTSVCNTGGWHYMTLGGMSENTRVACRQLGYSEEGATFDLISAISSITATGLRQGMCSGSELQLIDCPAIGGTAQCFVGTIPTCQPATCDTTIRLRGGSTATEGRVEVCRDGQWGTVCDDSWDSNDASVACRQLGLSDFNAMAIPSAHFGPGSGRIHLSNLQCTGSEATLADCAFNTQHQCSHNQDTSVICLDCSNEDTLLYTSETNTLEFCNGNMCNEACQEEVSQLGAHSCGSGEITHFLMNGSQLYECPISGVGEFLICDPTTQTLANNCQQVLPDIELQESSSSITVTWENVANAQNLDNSSTYEIICRVENSNLDLSIVVDAATREVTVENLPHSTTYECCVTLHIGRYSTRACGNTATTTNSGAIQGAGLWVIIVLGVLVAVLVLLLVLVTGAWLHSRNKTTIPTGYYIYMLNGYSQSNTTVLPSSMYTSLSDEDKQPTQSWNTAYDFPISVGSMAAKSGTEAEYEVVDREQQQQPPNGEELKQNPAYSVHKTHPEQTKTDTMYETVDL